MDIRIGLADSPRELAIELPDDATAEDLKTQVESGLDAGGMIWITDAKGRQVGFNAARVVFFDIGGEHAPRMGFG